MTYYDDGKLYTVTDRNGDATTYTYTPSGKPAAVTYQDGTSVAFTYDLNDNLTAMEDSRGTTAYVYDEVNRLTSSTDPNGFTVAYEYDGAGNLATLTYPGGKTVSYTYDALNRLETVTIDWLALSAAYEYDLAGNLTGLTQFNGTYVSRGYDNANRLTRLEHLSSLAGSAFASYAFTLDGNGNRSGIDQETPLSPSLSALTRDFEVSDAGNRIVTAGSDALIYDEEGQLLTKGEDTFTFDQAHRLTGAATETDSLIFSYDGAGNRLAVDRNQTVTRYIYDAAGNLLAEADTSGITRYYIHGAGLLAMVTSGGTPYCYHFDATGHTIALTDAGKTVVNKYAYTPFGVLAGQEEAVEQPFKFVGQFGVMTEDNGWYYMRARYYDPEMGRFISEDPLGFGGGDVNLYAYVLNNPVMFNDPLGLYWFRQDWQEPGVVGRRGTPVPPHGAISEFIEQHVPAGYTFGQLHDAYVGDATRGGEPDWKVNIPSMPLMYIAAQGIEVLRSLGVIEQPTPSVQSPPAGQAFTPKQVNTSK